MASCTRRRWPSDTRCMRQELGWRGVGQAGWDAGTRPPGPSGLAALGVAETAQVENIIRTIKQNGEPLILISHNMRQVFDLVDRIVVFRRGRIAANLKKSETSGEEVVAYITGAKTDPSLSDAA